MKKNNLLPSATSMRRMPPMKALRAIFRRTYRCAETSHNFLRSCLPAKRLKSLLRDKHHSSTGCGRRPPWTSPKFLLEVFFGLIKSFCGGFQGGRFSRKKPPLFLFSISLFALSQAVEPPKPSIAVGQGDDIEALFDGYFRERIKMSPELAADIGIDSQMGYETASDRLDDESVEAIEKAAALNREYLQRLSTYGKVRLTSSQCRDAGLLIYALTRDREGEKFLYHPYVIDYFNGFHSNLTTLMVEYHTVENLSDANAYISRLGKYREKLRQLSDRIKIQAAGGIIPPKHIVERFSDILSSFIRPNPQGNILYTSFRQKLHGLDIPNPEKGKLCLEVIEKIETVVYPAYQEMIALVDSLKPKATEDAGVWKLPQGDEYYRYCLKYHTDSDLTPEQVHKIGLKEVKRIQQEIRKRLARGDIEEPPRFREMWIRFWGWEANRNRDKLYYPNTIEGGEQALQDYREYLQQITPKLPGLFSLLPKAKLLVRPAPFYKGGAYYQGVSADGKREGIFYMSLFAPPFKPGMKTLAVHEGIPGHHFQISLERESPGFRMFRYLVFFTAYVEGWALYTEKLALENGWFEDLYSQLGYLQSELLRAVRVVVDTGIHCKRWSYRQALDYMRDNLGREAPGEVDRYILWPGQACAYKIGELKILELRKRAQKELKKKFQLREFHAAILENGSAPLPILEAYIDEYIAKKK